MRDAPAPLDRGMIESVNVGSIRSVRSGKRIIKTAIWKTPVDGPVPVRGIHVGDDLQGDRRLHGGADKAVYAYASEDYAWWAGQLGRAMGPGTFGENLTLRGLDVSGAVIGELWRAGTALLEVSEPRTPCFKLGLRMEDSRFPKRFGAANRPGAYLRIRDEGEVGGGDEVCVVERPAHGVTCALVNEAYLADHSLAPRMLRAPQLSAKWRGWAAEHSPERSAAPRRQARGQPAAATRSDPA